MESSIPKEGKRFPREDTPGKTLGETPARTDWLNRFFTSYYAHRPVNATFIGLHDWDHRLPDLSEHGAGDTLADMQSLLSEAGEPGNGPVPGVGTVEGPSAGPGDPGGAESLEAVDRRLAEGFLRIQLWEYRSDHFHRGNPSLYSGEAIFGLMSLFLTDFAPFTDRAEAAVERMAAVPAFLAQGRDNVRRAPRAWTQRAIRECTGALAFLTGGVEHLLGECPAEVPGFRRNAERAAAAFRDYHLYLESELLPDPVARWACGEEAFSLYMKEGHFLDQDPDEIVAYAESALAEAAGELTGPSFQAADARPGLSDLHPSVDRYYGRYREVWDSVRERVEARSLLTWPDFPIRYIPRPEWAREAAPYLYFLFYRSPAAFNRPPVHDYLVTPIDRSMPLEKQEELLRATNDSVIKLNHVIHHGGVGHHVQNWHAFRSPSRIGRIAAVDCASRIAMFCGGTMAEGWACYATDLMREAGALTQLEEVAEIRGRTRMCARAIADVRLHQGRFTLEQATNYYVEQAGMERGPAHSEAVKNSMFPGAAVIYLLGTDSIHHLRREMSVRLGQRFDLRSFHDDFLSYGSIPVSLIGAHMKGKAGHAG